ncbi:magnesium transporter NIPA-domain-containing protein [Lipomyces japonicus]|uniref:magnesium transporter NIPA-domain-containing protein n=1 Tax=Lipomyces japonicus TaxID=56871 RepID=UPI0034CF3805
MDGGATGQTIAIGIVAGLVSNVAQSFGLTMQRKSHMLEDDRPLLLGQRPRPPYKRKRWLIGMGLFLAANIFGSGFQITALPLVILAPLQASSLVFNSICATIFLAEPFTRYSLLGTIFVAAGAILIAAFGALPEPNHSLEELLYLLSQSPFLAWFGSTIVIVVVLLLILRMMRTWRRGHSRRGKITRGVLFGIVSGILSAHTLLLAKSAVELLLRSIVDKDNQFTRWQTWLIVLGLVVLALTQLVFLHQGLKLCSTSVLYPLVFCVYNIVTILDGLIYFQQASRLSSLQVGLVALGTILLLCGVAALSWRLNPAEPSRGKDDAETLTTMPSSVEQDLDDHDAAETDGLLLQQQQQSLLPRLPLHDSKKPWTSKKLGVQERSEIWNELGDYDDDYDDDNDDSSNEYRIAVDYDDDDVVVVDDDVDDESLTTATTSSSASRQHVGHLGRVIAFTNRVKKFIQSQL